ncbi:MAG: ADP-ribosylglycohydrolase family protein [Acidimicrobiia bacterium]|nr:ADP-ribosylglycohydrolase family protein [Acidimicrobiia bacterium]
MTGTTSTINLADRYRGAMVGTAVGDALGAPTEGQARVPPAYLETLDTHPNLSYTDDTAMTLAVARSLVDQGGFEGPHMAATLAAQFAAEPFRGYGSGPPIVFFRLENGVSWDQASRSLFNGTGSYGNGASMRVAPVALHTFPDLDSAAECAAQTALITHSHPEGIDGAVAQTVAIALLLNTETLNPQALIRTVRSHVKTPVFRDKLSFLAKHAGSRDAGELAEVLGTGIAAHASVVTALGCFLSSPDSFSEAVKSAVGLGGDTDTIAAMTGALAGAHLGHNAIPPAWQSVEGSADLCVLADRLHSRYRAR